MTALPCPFCGALPAVAPEDPETEGNAWAWVFCANRRCVTYDSATGHGVNVDDGARSCDERGSNAYKRAAIRRWNRRAATASPLGRQSLAREDQKQQTPPPNPRGERP